MRSVRCWRVDTLHLLLSGVDRDEDRAFWLLRADVALRHRTPQLDIATRHAWARSPHSLDVIDNVAGGAHARRSVSIINAAQPAREWRPCQGLRRSTRRMADRSLDQQPRRLSASLGSSRGRT